MSPGARNAANGPTIAAVGDFMISRRPTRAEIEVTRELFAGADLVIANIDSVLSPCGDPAPKWANLRGPREAAHDLSAMGIDVAIFANNHAMDFGAAGMLDSRAAFEESGMLCAGAGPDLAGASAPVFVERRGIRMAILAAACTLPVGSPAGPGRPGVAPIRVRYAFEVDELLFSEQPGSVPPVRSWINPEDLERVRTNVSRVASQADITLFVIHWGVPRPWRAPFHPTVQEYQTELGTALVDAGADAVIGNHAHELHGAEFRRTSPIAYCLGNFWIDTIGEIGWLSRESVVMRLVAGKSGITSVAFDPIVLDDRGIPGLDPSGAALRILAEQSKGFGVEVDGRTGRLTGAR